jgi:hypothetical protein
MPVQVDAWRISTSAGHDPSGRSLSENVGITEVMMGRLRSYLGRRIPQPDAADLVQETILRALASNMAGAHSPERYLLAIAKNVLTDFRRIRGCEKRSADLFSQSDVNLAQPSRNGGQLGVTKRCSSIHGAVASQAADTSVPHATRAASSSCGLRRLTLRPQLPCSVARPPRRCRPRRLCHLARRKSQRLLVGEILKRLLVIPPAAT